jgi:ABC-type spermidine/putrescine transport system permease subunit II
MYQNFNMPVTSDDFAYASVFAGNFSLLVSVIIGIIAAFLVFRAAKKLGGGLFEIVLNYVGIGMSFVVLGTLFSVVGPWLEGFWFNVVSTTFFALGYIFMVLGANKLLKGIIST